MPLVNLINHCYDMSKLILIIIFLVYVPVFVFSQNYISGKVTDLKSKRALAGAQIQILNSAVKTITNDTGYFFLQLPEGNTVKIKISFIGYARLIKELDLSGPKNYVEFYLTTTPETLPEVFITANRTLFRSLLIPAGVSSISSDYISALPVNNTDEILRLIPGVNIDRDIGVFSKNSSISMRGLGSANRSLILLDGVPLNKADGGGVNWNRINPDFIEKIEVIKGPNSTVYGGNAMSGVVNIITQRPNNTTQGGIRLFGGTYGTYGVNSQFGGLFSSQSKIYYNLSGFFKSGNGYVLQPDSLRDSLDINAAIWETEASLKLGYILKENSYIEIEQTFYDDKRSDGFRVFEEEGGYYKYTTSASRLTYHGNINKIKVFLNAFYTFENYFRQSESLSVKKNNKYTFYHTDSKRIDEGIFLTFLNEFKQNQGIISGIDLKQGSVNASDIYFTSSDILTNKGKMINFAIFTDYHLKFLKNKLSFNTGIRFDQSFFRKGSFSITEPSTFSEFMVNYPSQHNNEQWQAISFKSALKYFAKNNLNFYLAYGKGFRPPTLDDMCKNGNITKGFKMANPQLKPEKLSNMEFGYHWDATPSLKIEHSFYYSVGHDFQYFVNNGDSVYTGGDNLKPVLQRQNIGEVSIFGTELSIRWLVSTNIDILVNYAYNHSVISHYAIDTSIGKDLTGKYLMEVAPNILYSGILWRNRFLNTLLSFQFRDKQWSDDENITFTPARLSFDVKFSRIFKEKWNISLSVQDIFNNRFIDTKGQLSPGRFMMISAGYKFINH